MYQMSSAQIPCGSRRLAGTFLNTRNEIFNIINGRHLPLATYVAEDRAKMFDMDNANPIPYYTATTKIRSRRGGSIGERRVQITQMR